MGLRIKLLFLMFFVISSFGYSQDKLLLTLEKSISLALEKNPEIRKAEKEVQKAGAGIGEAFANILPQLDCNVNFQHSWEIQESVIPNFIKFMLPPGTPGTDQMPDYVQIAFGLENTFIYGATVRQPLFLGGAGIAGIQMAFALRRVAMLNLQEKQQDLIYQTVNAFYLALLAHEMIAVQQEALEQAKANFDIVNKKYKVGMASNFDKMRAEVEVANLKPQVIAAQNNYRAALTQLRTIIGLPRDTKLEVKGEFEYIEDEIGEMSLREIQELAFKNRPLIKAVAQQKYISKKGVTIARSSFLPKLFFQTDYSYLAMRNDYNFRQADFSKGFTSALSLQVPLFHGLRSSMQYQKARLDYKIMLDAEKQIYDGIAAESEIAYNKFHEAKEKYFSAIKTVELATEALRLANIMYEEGANTQLDVLNSQLALTRARLSHLNALYEYQLARYQLRKVVGRLQKDF